MKNKEYEIYPTIAKISQRNQDEYYVESLSKLDLLNRIVALEDIVKKQNGMVLQYSDIVKQQNKLITQYGERITKLEKGYVKEEPFKQNVTTEKPVIKNSKISVSDILSFGKFKKISVGDIITFGNYGGEGISWKVLDIKDGKAFLLSQYAIDSVPFNIEKKNVDWSKCSLRKWLNNDFKGKAFSDGETKSINSEIALLSVEEAETYLATAKKRECEATAFAKDNGIYVADNGKVHWWLKDKGSDSCCACCVRIFGYINQFGYYVDGRTIGVRPVLWINL